MKTIRSSVHTFTDLSNTRFSASDYSKLKFGSDRVAKKFGHELATNTFQKHSDILLANRCVVIPSPYNHVANAATVTTNHFVDRLNRHLVANNGMHVEYSVIHRKVSYISDYGFLPKSKRKGLIDNDKFFLNKDFYKDKLLIFVDDVRITGTHEDKLEEILEKEGLKNDRMYLYYAQLEGNHNPAIESELNFAFVKSVDDFISLSKTPNHHMIVRPIKYILGQKDERAFDKLLASFTLRQVEKLYYGCLGEGYYAIPEYQKNFQKIKEMFNRKIK